MIPNVAVTCTLEAGALDALFRIELGGPLAHDAAHLGDLGGEGRVGIGAGKSQVGAVRAVLDDKDGDIISELEGAAGALIGGDSLGPPGIELAVNVDEAGGVDVLPASGLLDNLLRGAAELQAVLETVGVGEERSALLAGDLGGVVLGDHTNVAGERSLPVLETA